MADIAQSSTCPSINSTDAHPQTWLFIFYILLSKHTITIIYSNNNSHYLATIILCDHLLLQFLQHSNDIGITRRLFVARSYHSIVSLFMYLLVDLLFLEWTLSDPRTETQDLLVLTEHELTLAWVTSKKNRCCTNPKIEGENYNRGFETATTEWQQTTEFQKQITKDWFTITTCMQV